MQSNHEPLRQAWQRAWPEAIACWSNYLRLSEPRWCTTKAEVKSEGLAGSFAMIRLVDHAVVIDLARIEAEGLARFSVEILAHEVGHHVLCPADLTDNARLLGRIRKGIPGQESQAPMVANLYADLLINDRLQRSAGLDMIGVFRKLAEGKDPKAAPKLWGLYMRVYELLWSAGLGELGGYSEDERMEFDARLGARVVRVYAKDWLHGGGRFAALCLPYLDSKTTSDKGLEAWGDALEAGAGGEPDGLTDADEGDYEEAKHPAYDPKVAGESPADDGADGAGQGKDGAAPDAKPALNRPKGSRMPGEYTTLMQQAGSKLKPQDLVIKYYKERALQNLVRFPARRLPQSTDPLPEGLDVWDIGGALDEVDWLQSVLTSPVIVPGVTTRLRTFGTSPGTEPERRPVDLYLGVDCSGSMGNPARTLSWPVLAGTIVALSALRAGAHVMVALSGEPGKTMTTPGFVRDERAVMTVLTGYLGTGYTFGIHRLHETFGKDLRKADARPAHLMIVTDNDIFAMLKTAEQGRIGWDVARDAAKAAKGGATFVLNSHLKEGDADLTRMRSIGWGTHLVSGWEQLVGFARRFSDQNYGL